MEWLTCLRKTVQYIEDHLLEEIDMDTLARQAYISPYYLQKGFAILTGCTIAEYIRSRRLYEAGREIACGQDRILDIALRWGYESPESFTKAFTRFHGVTPSQARGHKESIRRFAPFRMHIEITGGNRMDYTVSPMWGMKLIGFERVFNYENAQKEIPAFWDEICMKYCANTIYKGLPPCCPEEQAIIDNCIGEYGVCIDDRGEESFRYLIAGRYTGGDVPEGMSLVELPQGEWAKFRTSGPVPKAIQALNDQVFREWLPGNPEYELAGCYNIEWYSCDGNQTDEDYQSGVWLPVKRK